VPEEEGPPICVSKDNADGSAGSQQVGPGTDRFSRLERCTIWHDLSKSFECLWAAASRGVNAPNGNVQRRIQSPNQAAVQTELSSIISLKALVPVSTTVCIYLRLVGAFICNFRNLDFLGKRVGFSLGGGLLTAKNPLPEGLC
jgi:hypothetical protein